MVGSGAETMSEPKPTQVLLQLLEPVLRRVAELRPQDRTSAANVKELEDDLEQRFPWDGETSTAIRAEIRKGVDEGWLCHRGEPNARFSRVAKPTQDTHGLSVDVVSLEGEAVRHKHPKGEISLGFPADGGSDGAEFDGRAPGWVFCSPGSTHTPTVTGKRMHLIYFLPDGDVVWNPEE